MTELVAKRIVNAMPEKTPERSGRDHGNGIPSIEGTYEESHAIINKLAELGINLKDVTDKLEADVAAFTSPGIPCWLTSSPASAA